MILTPSIAADEIISKMIDLLVLVNPEGNIIRVNRQANELLGYSENELVGRPLSTIMGEEPIADDVARIREDSHRTCSRELACRTRKGEEIPVNISCSGVKDREGDLIGIVIVGQDIRQMKRLKSEIGERMLAEEALQNAHRELDRRVRERTAELVKVNETLRVEISERLALQAEATRAAHLASIGELAAGVAHEINNPINGIINYAQILLNKGDPASREYDIAGRIRKEGDRIATIVRNLLSFSRERKGERVLCRIPQILVDALSLIQTQLRKEGILLGLGIPEDLPEITANPQQLQQVFLNVTNNARYALNQKYPEPHENKIIAISCEQIPAGDPSHIRLRFRDHGSGIPSHLLEKVKNPFFTTKPAGRGTGLGLSISHSIISDHDGTLIIHSIEGEFTEIAITLPVKEAA
jgi:PAS domain S-box-containing protein